MDSKKKSQSKIFKITLAAIGALASLMLVFKIGVLVGYNKALYSYRWGENYHKNFAGPKSGFYGDFRRAIKDKDFIGAHGTFGTIIKVDGETLIVKGKDDIEKTVLVSNETTIRRRRETLKPNELKVDDRIVIIGSPNEQGQVNAKLIRVFR